MREDSIDAACPYTFQWIWQHSNAGLRAWLDDESPLYWVRGRPGSGKSTLMKYIWNHEVLSAVLSRRDSSISRIKAAFFFHHRGSHQQKSFEGMLHSILFRLLGQEPRLAAGILPEFHRLKEEHFSGWTLARLMNSYEAILAQSSFRVEVYLFLDALDEYDGRPEVIIDFIQSSIKRRPGAKTRLKACFSSREWSAFGNSFSDCLGLRIHEYTDQDIRTYLSTRLSSIFELSSLRESESKSFRDIEESIATRAQGVFIWVRAIMDILSQDYLQGVAISKLAEKAESFSADLDEFYSEAIQRIQVQYRDDSFALFEVVLRSQDLISVEELISIVHCATCDNLSNCIATINNANNQHDFSQWVQDRGAGLLELVDDRTTTRTNVVQFMHQTVSDFVAKPGFRRLILQQPLSLPVDNGYTFLSKFAYASIQMRDLTKCDKYIFNRPNYFSQAEATTGRSLKGFWDDVQDTAVSEVLDYVYWPIADIDDSKLAFAVIHSLTILLQEVIQSRNGLLSDTGKFSLLHCVVDTYAVGGPRRGRRIHPFPTCVPVGIVSILVRHGARLDAEYQGCTPFQALFGSFPYSRFRGSSGLHSTRPLITDLARQFLKIGQSPNVEISKQWNKRYMLDGTIFCRPLHFVPPDLIVSAGAGGRPPKLR
jgi:hypothetical protein